MGIDFSHGKACWSYSGFHRFRERLAREIGIDLNDMGGFARAGDIGFSWDRIKDDIVLLLRHSDCDGELAWEECEKLIPRLKMLISDWLDVDSAYDHEMALRLIKGMQKCVESKKSLKFI